MKGALALLQFLVRWRWLAVLAALLAVFIVYARMHDLETAIRRQYQAAGDGSIDLVQAFPSKAWTRVCILGPYSSSAHARALLGFEWNADAHSDVRDDDGVTLLVFASDSMVIAATDYPRAGPDFTPLATRCYPRSAAAFTLG